MARRTTQVTLAAAVVALVIDLVTKWLAHLTDGDVPLVTPVTNDQLALGVASLDVGLVPLLALLAGVIFVTIHGWMLSRSSDWSAVFYGLLVGGVAGGESGHQPKTGVGGLAAHRDYIRMTSLRF